MIKQDAAGQSGGVLILYKSPPARSSGARRRRNKFQSVISGDMCVGNDTSHERFADNFIRNRGESFVQSFSKK